VELGNLFVVGRSRLDEAEGAHTLPAASEQAAPSHPPSPSPSPYHHPSSLYPSKHTLSDQASPDTQTSDAHDARRRRRFGDAYHGRTVVRGRLRAGFAYDLGSGVWLRLWVSGGGVRGGGWSASLRRCRSISCLTLLLSAARYCKYCSPVYTSHQPHLPHKIRKRKDTPLSTLLYPALHTRPRNPDE
jgi:hypothetical protein